MDNNFFNSDRRVARIKRTEFPKTRSEYKAGYIAAFCSAAMLVVVRMLFGFGLFDGLDSLDDASYELVISLIWPLLGGFVFPVFLYFTLRKGRGFQGTLKERFARSEIKEVTANIGLKKLPIALILFSILLGIVYAIANSGIATITQTLLINMGFRIRGGSGGEYDTSFFYLFVSIIVTGVFPAFIEEIMDRGILLYSLKRHGETKAIMLTALCFALFHMNLAQLFYTFAMGIVTGILTVKLKNIWPAIIIHFINNAGGVLLYHLYACGLPGQEIYTLVDFLSVNAPYALFFIWMLAIGGSVPIIIGMIKYNKHLKEVKSYEKRQEEFDQRKEAFEAGRVDTAVLSEAVKNAETVEEGSVTGQENLPNGVIRIYKPAFKDKLFFIATLVLAGIATIFSFVWAIM